MILILKWLEHFLRGIVVLFGIVVGVGAFAGLALCTWGIVTHRETGLVVLLAISAVLFVLASAFTYHALQPWLPTRPGISIRRFRYVASTAFFASLLLCAAAYAMSSYRLRDEEMLLTVKRAELARLGPMDAEVQDFIKRKDHLQRLVDLINVLKQNQRTVVRGVETVSALGEDAASIEHVALRPDYDRAAHASVLSMIMHGHADLPDAVDRLARKLGAQKAVGANHSFTLKATVR